MMLRDALLADVFLMVVIRTHFRNILATFNMHSRIHTTHWLIPQSSWLPLRPGRRQVVAGIRSAFPLSEWHWVY